MKVVCDVCEAAPAAVLCFADAAATCLPCDARVHAANKLAAKHQRAAISSASAAAGTTTTTCCDICQELAPFLFFCLEDRAILCRHCDLTLHPATALSANHRRFFLLTGISVSSSSSFHSTAPPPHASSSSSDDDDHHHLAPKCPLLSSDLPQNSNSSAADDASYVHLVKTKSTSSFATAVSSPPIHRLPALVPNVINSSTHEQHRANQPNNNNNSTSTRMPSSSSSSSSPPPCSISIRRLSTGSVPFVAPVLTTVSHILHGGSNPLSHLDQHPHRLNPHDTHAASVIDSSCRTSDASTFVTTTFGAHGNWKKLADELLNDDEDDSNMQSTSDHVGLHSTSTSGRSPAASGFKGKDYGVAEVPEMIKLPTLSVADLWTFDGTLSSTKAGEQNCNDVSSCGVEAWDFDCLFDSSKSPYAESTDDDVSVVPDIISVSFGRSKKRRKFNG